VFYVAAMDYYLISGEDSKDLGQVEVAPSFDFDSLSEAKSYSNQWPVVQGRLVAGKFTDFMGCDVGWALFSEGLKAVIEPQVKSEKIEWLPINVISGNFSSIYFICHLFQKMDMLNREKTIFASGTSRVIKPVFDVSKVEGHHMFSYEKSSAIYVSAIIMKAVRGRFTGLAFEHVNVA
jgi:hypothetical protein